MKPGRDSTCRNGERRNGSEGTNSRGATSPTLEPPKRPRLVEIGLKRLLRVAEQAADLPELIGDALWLEFERPFLHDERQSSSGG
jgi:hypothetical protein